MPLLWPLHQYPWQWSEFPAKIKMCVNKNEKTKNDANRNVTSKNAQLRRIRKLKKTNALTSLNSCSLFNWSWNCVNNSFGKPVIVTGIRCVSLLYDECRRNEKWWVYRPKLQTQMTNEAIFCLFAILIQPVSTEQHFRCIVVWVAKFHTKTNEWTADQSVWFGREMISKRMASKYEKEKNN